MKYDVLVTNKITIKFSVDNPETDDYMESMVEKLEADLKAYDKSIYVEWDYNRRNDTYTLTIEQKSEAEFFKSHSYYEPDYYEESEDTLDEESCKATIKDLFENDIDKLFTIVKTDREVEDYSDYRY